MVCFGSLCKVQMFGQHVDAPFRPPPGAGSGLSMQWQTSAIAGSPALHALSQASLTWEGGMETVCLLWAPRPCTASEPDGRLLGGRGGGASGGQERAQGLCGPEAWALGVRRPGFSCWLSYETAGGPALNSEGTGLEQVTKSIWHWNSRKPGIPALLLWSPASTHHQDCGSPVLRWEQGLGIVNKGP